MKNNLVLIDDDLHQKNGWERYAESATIRYYASPEAIPVSVSTDTDAFFVVDYDLKNDVNGVQFILKNRLRERAVLVTDNYNDPHVIAQCERHRIRFFPKHWVSFEKAHA